MDAPVAAAPAPATETLEIELLTQALHRQYGYDFRHYAPESLRRRLGHVRQRFGCRTISQLQDRLLHDAALLPQFLHHITVQVSEMFRDPAFFAALRTAVVPHLRTYPRLRVWVAGCSTGEELYSLAILFREEGLEERTQFYATDINPEALRQAEQGIYSLDRIAQFTRNHQASGAPCSLSEYYTAGYGAAAFDKTLRQRTVFADHSLASDAVFGEMHLVVCRNVLIYFQSALQDRALGLFHDSLVRQGFLGLGARESLRFSAFRDRFDEFAPAERIYRKLRERE